MPIVSVTSIESRLVTGGVNIFPLRRIAISAGRRGLNMVIARNTNVPSTWFRAGRVVWELVLGGGPVYGVAADELWFGEQISYLPPSSLFGNDLRATIYLREFLPAVIATYGQLVD
jgi:hypothetical protein